MAAAQIVIVQGGTVGAAGSARDDITTGTPVQLRNANDNGVTGWRWKLTRPKGSVASITNVVAAQPSFTPDVTGTYVVELQVNGGASGERAKTLVAVRNAGVTVGLDTFYTRYFGIGESNEANWTVDLGGGPVTNDTGWWEDIDRWLRLLQSVASSPSGGGRLVTNPAPTFGGAPGAYTYSVPADELFDYFDPGGVNTLAVTLPAITGMDPGQYVGIELPLGNPTTTITITPDAAEVIFNPITGAAAGPPGTPLVLAAGALPASARIVWEGVDGTTNFWVARFDAGTLGASGGGDWNAALSAGPESGGVDPVITDEDEIQWHTSSEGSAGTAGNWTTARQDDFTSGASGGTVVVGSDLHTRATSFSDKDLVQVAARGIVRLDTVDGTSIFAFRIEEVWSLDNLGGGGAVDTVILRTGHATSAAGTLGRPTFKIDSNALYLTVDEGAVGTAVIDISAVIDVDVVIGGLGV